MNIIKVKYWSKVIQLKSVDHVKISFSDFGQETTIHEFGNNSTASPDFYKAMESFRESVCIACGWNLDLASSISVRELTIKPSEDKEGNDNTVYTVISSLKAGHTSATLRIDIQHKYLPDGFEDGINYIVEQAEKYVEGERAQTELDLPPADEIEELENADQVEEEQGEEIE